jgi:hypothetical protein
MSEIETSISDLKDLRNSLLNKSANLDSSLLSMDKYVIANLRKVIVNAIEKIDVGITELEGYLQVAKNNKKWD